MNAVDALEQAETNLEAALDEYDAAITVSDRIRTSGKVTEAAQQWRIANKAWDTEHTLDLGGKL